GAGPDRLDRDRLQRSSLEGTERFRHFAGCAPQLTAGGKPAIDAERRLLPARPVESTEPAGLEPELEQLLQRLGILLADLALTDRREEHGESSTALVVPHHREDGLGLTECDLAGLALQLDRASHAPRRRGSRAARVRSRRFRSRNGSRTPWARSP